MITITKLDEDRWQDYRDIRLEALKNEPLAFSSSFEEEQSLPETLWQQNINNVLFAISDNKPVGMIGFFCNNHLKTKHVCEIYGVYVKKEHRGQGIGKQLMEAAIAEIKNLKGITKIRLEVNPTQKAAERLYRKLGFKEAGRLKKEPCCARKGIGKN